MLASIEAERWQQTDRTAGCPCRAALCCDPRPAPSCGSNRSSMAEASARIAMGLKRSDSGARAVADLERTPLAVLNIAAAIVTSASSGQSVPLRIRAAANRCYRESALRPNPCCGESLLRAIRAVRNPGSSRSGVQRASRSRSAAVQRPPPWPRIMAGDQPARSTSSYRRVLTILIRASNRPELPHLDNGSAGSSDSPR